MNKTSEFLNFIGFRDSDECIESLVQLYTCEECVLSRGSIIDLIESAGVDISTEQGYNTIITLLDDRSGEGESWVEHIHSYLPEDDSLGRIL